MLLSILHALSCLIIISTYGLASIVIQFCIWGDWGLEKLYKLSNTDSRRESWLGPGMFWCQSFCLNCCDSVNIFWWKQVTEFSGPTAVAGDWQVGISLWVLQKCQFMEMFVATSYIHSTVSFSETSHENYNQGDSLRTILLGRSCLCSVTWVWGYGYGCTVSGWARVCLHDWDKMLWLIKSVWSLSIISWHGNKLINFSTKNQT